MKENREGTVGGRLYDRATRRRMSSYIDPTSKWEEEENYSQIHNYIVLPASATRDHLTYVVDPVHRHYTPTAEDVLLQNIVNSAYVRPGISHPESVYVRMYSLGIQWGNSTVEPH